MNNQSPREQTGTLLEAIKDSHDLSEGEAEEIAGRPTFHIIAKAKDKKALIGDVEIWIDKETWLPLKQVSHSGGQAFTLEYQKIEFNPKMEDDLFVLDIPEDATIERIAEESYVPKEADFNEVKEELGKFYQVHETDELELAGITFLEGLEDRKEFSFEYSKDDMAAFSVTVFKDLPNVEDFGGAISEEEIIIRGQKATKMELGDYRSLDWVEESLKYVVTIENPTIEFEEVLKYLEEMVLTE